MVIIYMDITHTVLSIPMDGMVTILMAMALADWAGEVTAMVMVVDGEAQTWVVKHQMLHTITVDLQV
jgi:short subunit dehydrogenase-like uncharacterized protein